MRSRRLCFALASFGVLAAAALGVGLGASRLELTQLAVAVRTGTMTPSARILLYVRLPRVAGALLCGAGLAVSGAVMQVVLGNPLASPHILGVNAGAGLCVLLAASLLPAWPALRPLAAFAGALLTALAVLLISANSGFSRLTVMLTGFAVGSVLSAGMNAVLLIDPDAYVGSAGFLSGGLAGLTLPDLATPAALTAAGLAAALLLCRSMNVLVLGEDRAAALGMRVAVRRVLLLTVAAALAGAAVSFAGMVGFVGLAAPHMARSLAGQDNRYVVPASALFGAALTALCDLLARTLFAPYELPVGILLAAVGGPFFLFLVLRESRGRL